MLEQFKFKEGPLYVEQISTSGAGHTVYVGVNRDAFCLLSPDARRAAAQAVYERTDRRLRQDGVRDLAFVVVPVQPTAPRREQALAIGQRGRLRLTARGRRC